MAPPSRRRPGYSKRAQTSIFIGYLLAILGAIVGLLLLGISIVDPRGFAALRTMGAEATALVSRPMAAAGSSLGDAGAEVSAYFNAASKNAQLKRQWEAARNEIREARALKKENAQLRQLLRLAKQSPDVIATGRLISSSASSSIRAATISVGRIHDVERGQPVRAPAGLVGRVLEVGPSTARILLSSDKDNVTPVKRASDGEAAFATGLGNGMVRIQPISGGGKALLKGDLFVTSGNGGLYYPNIPVAVITKVTDSGATARLLARPGKTDYVIVESIYQPKVIEEQAEIEAKLNPETSE